MYFLNKYRWFVIVTFLGAISIWIFYQRYNNSYVKLRPLDFNTTIGFYEIKPNDSIRKFLPQVLNYYQESYQIDDDGNIMVKRRLANDRELIWNYTTKSLDTAWLKDNLPKK